MASDAGNQSPERASKKKSCEKLVRHAFHVVNVTLFGYRGTSSANWLSSGSSSTFCMVSRGFKLGIVYQFPAKTTTNEQFPRCTCTQLCCRVTPAYHCSTLNDTLFERKCFQPRFLIFQTKTKSEPGHRRHHDSPPPEQQEFCLASDCQFRKSSCLNRTSFKH